MREQSDAWELEMKKLKIELLMMRQVGALKGLRVLMGTMLKGALWGKVATWKDRAQMMRAGTPHAEVSRLKELLAKTQEDLLSEQMCVRMMISPGEPNITLSLTLNLNLNLNLIG